MNNIFFGKIQYVNERFFCSRELSQKLHGMVEFVFASQRLAFSFECPAWDNTLLTVDFNLRAEDVTLSPKVLQGRHI